MMKVSRNKYQDYRRNERFQRYYKRRRKINLAKSIGMLVAMVVIVLVGSTYAVARFGNHGILGGVTEDVTVDEHNNTEGGNSNPTTEEQGSEDSKKDTEDNNENTEVGQDTQDNHMDTEDTTEDETKDDVSKDDETKDDETKGDENKTQWVGVGPAGLEHAYDAKVISEKLRKYSYSNQGEKLVFLTFDDGTSTTVTPKILKVLDDYNVKATFFLTGSNILRGGEAAKELVLEEFERGHAIANHSYSHDYKILYPNRVLNLQNFIADFKKTDQILKEIIGEGFSTRVIRCPGGFMSWKNMSQLSAYMEEKDLVSIDWNALSKDAEGPKKSADQLLANVKETAAGKEIVVLLMHDTYGKEETAKALPKVIEYFQQNGYEFKTLV